jgi:proteasome accessory factor B
VTVAVERIRSLDVTEEAFTVDSAFDPKRYEAEAFGVAWEKPMTVVVRFSSDQAPYVRERQWHPTQKLRELRDGRIELRLHAGGRFEIMRWVLSWGEAAQLVRPPTLRREIAAKLRAVALQYRHPASSRSTPAGIRSGELAVSSTPSKKGPTMSVRRYTRA